VANLRYQPVRHDHKAFLAKAHKRPGFTKAYNALALEYQIVDQLLRARTRAGLTQEAIAERMKTTKSAVCRLEGGMRHAPSISTLRRYANAVGCDVQVKLIPRKSA
jgi:DNA-binding XRE family transcriptional regulator